MNILDQILDAIKNTRVELQPLFAVISVAVIWFMKLVKDPTRMKWFTVYSKRGRAWTVMALSFIGTFALGIALGIRLWVDLAALSVIMALITVGAYEWLRAAGDKPEAPKREDDPRRP